MTRPDAAPVMRARELGSTLPIVFLTGHSDVPTTVRTIKAGAEDFLLKPVSPDDLLHAVQRAVARHEVARGLKIKLDMVRARVARLTPPSRIGVKIVGSLFDIDVFFLAVRGDAGEAQSWIVAGDRLWAAE
jgi:DNA-binding response OmpR family regulator